MNLHEKLHSIKQLPISEFQKRFFLEWALAPDDCTYNEFVLNKISGNLNIEVFRQACEVVVKTNQVFHAQYSDDGAHSWYRSFEIDDCFFFSITEPGPIEFNLNSLINIPFDLTKDILLRFYLIQSPTMRGNEFYFLFVAHHIVVDLVTAKHVINQIGESYNLLLQGLEPNAACEGTFTKAIETEAQIINTKYKEKAQEYWLQFIGDTSLNISLPYRSDATAINLDHNLADKTGDFIDFELDKSESDHLRAFVKQRGTSLFIALSGLYGLILNKYSNQGKLLISYPINVRPKKFMAATGSFVNNLPLKIDFDKEETFDDLLHSLTLQRKEVREFQHYSFTDIVGDQKKYREGETNGFINAGFIQSNLSTIALHLDDAEASPVGILNKTKVYNELGLIFDTDHSGHIRFRLEYRKALFERDLIKRFIASFLKTLADVATGAEIAIRKYSVLGAEESERVLSISRPTYKNYPENGAIHRVFEAQCIAAPSKTALVFEGQTLSYQNLNEKSNQLARRIRAQYECLFQQPLRPDVLIALYVERSLEMLVGILAILKAGAAYVPLETNIPQDRLDFILADSNAELILCMQRRDGDLKPACLPGNRAIAIDLGEPFYQSEETANLPDCSSGSDLAYVIYTSGTTGKPKGVMVEHKSVLNLVDSIKNSVDSAGETDNILSQVSFGFDAFVNDWTKALLNGGTLFYNSMPLGSAEFVAFVNEHKITQTVFPSALLKTIKPSGLPTLKKIVTMGDLNDRGVFDEWSRHLTIINGYGPTENTVCTTQHKYSSGDSNTNIGTPLYNTCLYLLDAYMQPVPIGVVGELHIGGAGLARGYLNRPDLTAERFIPNPFATELDELKGYTRLYRTGDLMRWLPDGNLEFIGRADNQVKIRGFRVELGEIEHALMQISGVTQSCVVVKERETESGRRKCLVGYYVSDKSEALPALDLMMSELSRTLPEYMVPEALVALQSFPLTVNGKLDKRALPDPDFSRSSREYIAAGTEAEAALCRVWQQVLGLEQIGVTDDFFRIGGDSILSIQVSGLIRQLGYNCQVKDIFESRTVRRLSAALAGRTSEVALKTEQGLLTGEVGLLPIQQWFVDQVEHGSFAAPGHWNHSFLVRVPLLDTERLTSVIGDLAAYHDVLRIRFAKDQGGVWKQFYQPEMLLPELQTVDIREHTDAELQQLLTGWQSRFDLEHGPLFQAGYLHGYADGSARIFFAAHHMIMDAVSWRILAEDLKTLLSGRSLPLKGASYRQWVTAVRAYEQQHPGESAWWGQQLGAIPPSTLKQDETGAHAAVVRLDRELTKTLLQQASKAYHTEINDLLLSALAYTLQDINGQAVQGITLEGHGREDIDETLDTSRTIGWFTSMFPVRLEVGETIGDSIKSNKEHLRSIPGKGLGFGVYATATERNYNYSVLPPVIFNYMGQFDVQEGDWQIVGESSGMSMDPANRDQNLVNINGGVREGSMWFSIVTRLGQAITAQLADRFQAHLQAVAMHCIEKLKQTGPGYTPVDFKAAKISQPLLDKLASAASSAGNEIAYIFPATSLQQGFIYYTLSQPDDDAYRVQLLYDYSGELDVPKYVEAWDCCIARYPILRTAFNWEQEIIQVVYRKGKLTWQFHDLSHLTTREELDGSIEAIQLADRNQSFDLAQPTIVRVHIIRQSAQCYTILKTEHHSVADGWSGPVILGSVHNYYDSLKEGRKISVDEDVAYIKAQEYISRNRASVQAYWEKTLSGAEGANDISALLSAPTDLRSYRSVANPASKKLSVTGDLYKSLKDFSQREGVTLNVIVQFIWHKLLQVYSGSKMTIVGTTVSGRDLPIDGIEESAGLYINTLPLVIDWDNEHTIKSQLQHIQQRITELNTHSYADLAKLQKNGERLFHSLFVYENYPIPKDSKETSKISLRRAVEKVDYPLSITSFEHHNELSVSLDYDGACMDDEKAGQLITMLERILLQVLQDSGKPHKAVSLLGAEECAQIVDNWNATKVDYPEDKTILDLFEEQAAKTPGNAAVVFGDRTLTYSALNIVSNQLADYLRLNYSINPDDLVGIKVERGEWMIVAMLGVLKSGGAYVPIDPDYPQERIDYMISDSGCRLVLDEEELTKFRQNQDNYDHSNKPVCLHDRNLAYCIYTSGSTGNPKGVLLEHRGLVNLALTQTKEFKITASYRILQLSSISFDTSVEQIWMALVNGATSVIASKELREDINSLEQYIVDQRITYIDAVPSLLGALSVADFSHLKYVISAGEACTVALAEKWKGKCNFYNSYGPTETTVTSNQFLVSSAANYAESIPIGKPLSNTYSLILDADRNLLPPGLPGELYIGGAGVARGYLDRPELTAQKFIENPYKPGDRIYRTGDLVRWLPDGSLEYLGRIDDQVKIRGFRIELGEIEHALSQISGISLCCVIALERQIDLGTSKYLAGYYTLGESTQPLSQDFIVTELSRRLPEYMVPAALVEMKSFPLTANGKVDKKALPDPDFRQSSGEYASPATEAEAALCRIWQHVLGLERVGVTDDFFRIGGDSILSIQVSGLVRQLGYNCQVKDVFESRTVRQLATVLIARSAEVLVNTEQGILAGELGLLPIQQWFAEQVNNGAFTAPGHWNQSFLVHVPEHDVKKLVSVISELVSYHDVLRIRFAIGEDGGWKQYYQSEVPLPELRTVDTRKHTEVELQQILTKWQLGFDLEHGPLFQAGYLYGYADGSARIFFAAHHMIMDTVSWRILAEDLKTLLGGRSLARKGSSYRQWVNAVRAYEQQHPGELLWWGNQLSSIPASSLRAVDGGPCEAVVRLDGELTRFLLKQASESYHTGISDLLLTALAYALQDLNGQAVQGITLEGHGREDIDASLDTSHTVGWFTTMFPVRLKVRGTIGESIRSNKEHLRSIPGKGLGFGVFATSGTQSYGYSDLPPIIFNYLGQFDAREVNWQIVDEASGRSVDMTNRDHNLVNINGGVQDGSMWFSFITYLGEDLTQEFANRFLAHLEAVTVHCIEKLGHSGAGFTPGDFEAVKISQPLLDRLASTAFSAGNEIARIFPATSLQQGFIYYTLSHPDDDAYREQLLYDYQGELDVDKYIEAWECCIAKYPILRTAFNWEEDIIQVIYRKGQLAWQLHDISRLASREEQERAIETIQIADRQQGFDLEAPSLLRVHIIRQSAKCYTILKSEHHSVADGWSGPILLASVHEYYEKLKGARKVNIEEDVAYIKAQEYIWQNRSVAQAYWEKTLAATESANDISPLLSAPIDLHSYRSVAQPASKNLAITGEFYKSLRNFGQSEGVTINVIVQFIWHKLLQVYSGRDHTIVGTTVSGRDLPVAGIEDSAGLYINTLPLVIDWDNDQTIQFQLQQIQQRITELNTHSYASLAKLQRNGERLFHSLFVYENYPMPEEIGATSKISLRESIEKIDYPLSITALEQGAGLTLSLGYDAHYITDEKAENIVATLERMLRQVMHEPCKSHRAINLLNAIEYDQMVRGWNAVVSDFPKDNTICRLFEEQALRVPDNIAVTFEGERITYRELDEKSNRLAKYLRSQYQVRFGRDLATNTLIAIYMDRCPDLIVGMLGILKAGAAYVPIDTSYPTDRVAFILEDSGAQMILVESSQCASRISNHAKDKLIAIEDVGVELTGNMLPAFSLATDLAYVIYTSGTTGKPKGVMLHHAGLNNLTSNFIRLFNISQSSTVSQLISISFDAALAEIFPAIIAGGTLCIIPDRIKQGENLADYLRIQDISHFTVPADLLGQMEWTDLPKLESINVGGGVPKLKSLEQWSDGKMLFNTYGPTEITICATAHNFRRGGFNSNIGRALHNTYCYVLDKVMQPVPVGVTGELYIGGVGVAIGYLNRPDLTNERFIANPFADASGNAGENTRLYKTGDLVRWLPGGNLEFVGRNDDQVKIRGYRIELGEIEHALMEIAGIKQGCVVAKERMTRTGSIKYLVGYYVLETGVALSPADVEGQLSAALPEYMVPAALMQLGSLPLTVNGKLNRAALPEPVSGQEDEGYEAPATELERELCTIWEEVLGLERIGISDDFFRSGGDSILSIQASGRICQAGFNCHVKDIFEFRTIGKLAKHLSGKQQDITIKSEQGLLSGELDFLPVQNWFVEKVYNLEIVQPHYWNQSFLVRIPPSDISKLQTVIRQLVAYHDVLRIQFPREHNVAGWKQVYRSEIEIPELRTLDVSDLTEEGLQEILTEWQNHFDLERGPLFQAGYLYGYPDGSARLFLALHHMIIDSVSWRILCDDIKTLYAGKQLPPKSTSYRQWADAVKNYAGQHPAEMAWWENQLQSIADYQIKTLPVAAEVEFFELDSLSTNSLLHAASRAYNTEINDLLLTALAYALKEINHSNIQGITLEGHGREDIDSAIDHSRTAGWFTIMYPVKLELHDNLKDSIQFIKECLRNIPNKGIGFGVFASQKGASFSFQDLPQVSFNYLGQFDGKAGDWQITGEESGTNVHPANIDQNLVNIIGIVNNGRLGFTVFTRLGNDKTKQLSEGLRRHIGNIIRHCSEIFKTSGTQNTPSDFHDFIDYEIINEHLNEDPIFIFPPGTGGAESYYKTLVPKIKNKKLVMFNNFFLFMVRKGFSASDFTIEDLAKYYRILIQKLQPSGNYTFLGWSFGGILAFEVFKQLNRKTYDGNNLILLDSWFGPGKAEIDMPLRLIDYFRGDINFKYNPDCKLEGLNTMLFKADQAFRSHDNEDDESQLFEALQNYYLTIPANNVDMMVDKLQVINLNCHHFDMLEKYSDTISDYCLTVHAIHEMN